MSQPKPLAVFYADSHVRDRAWELAGGRDVSGDAYFSFKQIVDWAVERKVSAVFGAGDLLDVNVNKSDPIAFINWQMERLREAGIPHYFIQGQHEMATPPWLTSHPWPTYLSGQMVKVGSVDVFGLDYHPGGLLQIALAQIPDGADVLLCHQVWGDFMGSVASPEGVFGDVPRVSCVFTGDYHVRKETETRGRDGQRMKVISPGSTCMQSIDEPPEKFFYVLLDDATWRKVRLKTRPLLTLHVDVAGDVDDLVRSVDADLVRLEAETAGYDERVRKPLVWVHYPHRLAEHRVRIERAVNGRGHLFWKERPPEPPPEVVERRREARARGERRAATLLSELPAYLEARQLAHLQPDCERLLKAGNVEDELKRMRAEALK